MAEVLSIYERALHLFTFTREIGVIIAVVNSVAWLMIDDKKPL